jgi:hypothetical protein
MDPMLHQTIGFPNVSASPISLYRTAEHPRRSYKYATFLQIVGQHPQVQSRNPVELSTGKEPSDIFPTAQSLFPSKAFSHPQPRVSCDLLLGGASAPAVHQQFSCGPGSRIFGYV